MVAVDSHVTHAVTCLYDKYTIFIHGKHKMQSLSIK